MQPRIYHADEHHLRHDLLDPAALFVLTKLQESGYIAYLVGGSVRDLLLHRKPKDFDISTSAVPEQIKALFRNCILIGKRFRLAHIRFGEKIIEVSTFRSGDTNEDDIILRDNIWGNPEEDVVRRDFTINGLFYNPSNHEIIDYVGGWDDLKNHQLRVIGDPLLRFKQDPVRMIRLLKFRARFGFKIDPVAMEGLNQCCLEIKKSSSARILEEIFRMLELGFAEAFFHQLYEHHFLEILFPSLYHYFSSPLQAEIYSYLKALDSMNHPERSRPLDRGIAACALIFPILEAEITTQFLEKGKIPHIGEIISLTGQLMHKIVFESFTHFPRKIRMTMSFILHSQFRLTPLDKKKGIRPRFARHFEFPFALVFLKLRAIVDHTLVTSYSQWLRIFQSAQNKQRTSE